MTHNGNSLLDGLHSSFNFIGVGQFVIVFGYFIESACGGQLSQSLSTAS